MGAGPKPRGHGTPGTHKAPVALSPGLGNLYLAAERTFLAQVRTGIALMAFGFVVARFALFLRRLVPSAPSSGASLDPAAGAVLTVAGSALVAAAAWRQRKRWQAMAQGKGLIMDVRWDLALAAFVAVTGLALAAYLVTREHGAWP